MVLLVIWEKVMKIINFKIFEDKENSSGVVTAYLHDIITEMAGRENEYPKGYQDAYPSIVLCPGGAYRFTSEREWDPVALEYLQAGFNVFILDYSVGEKAKGFMPLMELSATIMKIRENADGWYCDPDKIAVIGFSAGGHLAASSAILWNNEEFKSVFDTKNGLNKPNAAILCYPVITADEFAHVESIQYVSGSEEGSEKYKWFSLDKHVDADTAPIFVWHTAEDDCVPVENTLKLISALQRNKKPFECHIFPYGGHGMSVCTHETGSYHEHNAQWVELSKKWLYYILKIEK